MEFFFRVHPYFFFAAGLRGLFYGIKRGCEFVIRCDTFLLVYFFFLGGGKYIGKSVEPQ